MNHVSPQGGSISRLYPTCYNTKVYTGGIYVIVNTLQAGLYMEYIMHECITTSIYSTRAKPEGCICTSGYARVHFTPYSPAWSVLTGL